MHPESTPNSCSGFPYMPLLPRICIFVGVFFFALIFVSILSGILNTLNIDPRTRILLVSSIQCVIVFMLAPVIEARLESRNILSRLSLDKSPRWINLGAIIICYIIGIIFLNQIIYWNDTITFPENLKGLETTMREWENNSREFANTILSTTSVGGLISGILIVGCLTGLAEELFFRAGVQRMLNEVMPAHVSVWIAALIFSAMHFQFFGFFPRLLLGAFFGYLYIWSGSIWTSAFAHAFNNSMVVITAWLTANGKIAADFEQFGVTESGIPWGAIISGILLFCFLSICHKWFIRHDNNGKSIV